MRLNKTLAYSTCILSLFSNSYAFSGGNLLSDYNLPKNELVHINGNLLTTRVLDCEVRSETTSGNSLKFVALKNGTIINGVILSEGKTSIIKTHIGEHIFFEMEHNAELGATNLDDGLVNLDCK